MSTKEEPSHFFAVSVLIWIDFFSDIATKNVFYSWLFFNQQKYIFKFYRKFILELALLTFLTYVNELLQWTLVIVNAWIVNNLSLVNIFGETWRLFYNINYMLNSKHLSLVNKIGDKTEFTITRVHCNAAHRCCLVAPSDRLCPPLPPSLTSDFSRIKCNTCSIHFALIFPPRSPVKEGSYFYNFMFHIE